MAKKLRGSGVQYTIHMVGRFAGLWLLVTVAAVVTAAASSYFLFVALMGEEAARGFLGPLALQATLTLVAVVALAIFTTHRLAGPWIALRRALEQVRDGRLDTVLRIRSADPYLRDVERTFNEMTVALRASGQPGGRPDAP
jgi:nitrogen fixation/metabolism regulation signal transduction histidine kinase